MGPVHRLARPAPEVAKSKCALKPDKHVNLFPLCLAWHAEALVALVYLA